MEYDYRCFACKSEEGVEDVSDSLIERWCGLCLRITNWQRIYKPFHTRTGSNGERPR